MKKFSEISLKKEKSISIQELKNYLLKMKDNLSQNVVKALMFCIENNILDSKTLTKRITTLSNNELKLMPHFLSKSTQNKLMNGTLSTEDITVDLSTNSGKNAAAKRYMGVLNNIVKYIYSKYSKVPKSEYMSKALEIMADAMNSYDYEKSNGTPFKTYLAYTLKNLLSNYAKEQSYIFSGVNWYAEKKYGASALSAVSLDLNKDDIDIDHMSELGEYDPEPLTRSEKSCWEKIFSILEKKFKQRQVDIFYRYFGLNGRKKEKAKDIAASYKISPSSINNNNIIPILKFLKSNSETQSILSELRDMYNESLLYELFPIYEQRDKVISLLENDDILILLEEFNILNSIDIESTLEECKKKLLTLFGSENVDNILDILKYGNFESIDSSFKTYKNIYITILHEFFPTEDFTEKTDIDIINMITDIQKRIINKNENT